VQGGRGGGENLRVCSCTDIHTTQTRVLRLPPSPFATVPIYKPMISITATSVVLLRRIPILTVYTVRYGPKLYYTVKEICSPNRTSTVDGILPFCRKKKVQDSIHGQNCVFCFFTIIVFVCFSSLTEHFSSRLEICESQHLCCVKMSQNDPLMQKTPISSFLHRTIHRTIHRSVFYRIYRERHIPI